MEFSSPGDDEPLLNVSLVLSLDVHIILPCIRRGVQVEAPTRKRSEHTNQDEGAMLTDA